MTFLLLCIATAISSKYVADCTVDPVETRPYWRTAISLTVWFILVIVMLGSK